MDARVFRRGDAAAYFYIPVTLLYFLRLRPRTPFPAMIVLFAAFIVLCGFGHMAMRAGTLKKSELEQFLRDASDAAGLVHGNLQRASELMQSFKQVAVDQASGERREIDLRQYLQEVVRSLSPALRMAKVKVHELAVTRLP